MTAWIKHTRGDLLPVSQYATVDARCIIKRKRTLMDKIMRREEYHTTCVAGILIWALVDEYRIVRSGPKIQDRRKPKHLTLVKS